jgi:hypothetical protein
MNSDATGSIVKKLLSAPDFDAQVDTLLIERFDKAYSNAGPYVLQKLKINIYDVTIDRKLIYLRLYSYIKRIFKSFLVSMKNRNICPVGYDMTSELIQISVFTGSSTFKDSKGDHVMNTFDIITIFFVIVVCVLNPNLILENRVISYYNTSTWLLGIDHLKKDYELMTLNVTRIDSSGGHAISFFKCNGREYIDFSWSQKNRGLMTIYPFKSSIFFGQTNKLFRWGYYLFTDIHLVSLNSSRFKDILGQTFELPPFNLVYKKTNGNYIFLLNNNFEEFNIPPENIISKYKYYELIVIKNLKVINVTARTFDVNGGKRTKRNRKNRKIRKGTRRLKRRQ